MQFSAEDDEADFNLNSATRSRLSSLFQGDSTKGDVNQALKFTAPKQPKKTETAQSNPGFQLICSGVVHAYKLQDSSYVNQGKLGCAVLGLHENALYQLLLYKSKQVQVTSCMITPNFNFLVQPNNYVNFYNEKGENWSINFESEASLIDFAKQVAIAKANSEGKQTFVTQELVLGDGPGLELGDSVEIRYTGWLLTHHAFGAMFDSNLGAETALRLKLGKSKVIKGWTEGLKGVQKGTKRLLVIPPSLAYGTEGKDTSVPPNSTLIFEIAVTKLKKSRESSHSPSPKLVENVPDKKPEVLPRSSFSQEDNIRLRGVSISEQLTQSPKKDKAQLISRMAKMGTATLPFQGAIASHVSSDSEQEDELGKESPPVQTTVPKSSSPEPVVKPSPQRHPEPVPVTQVAPSQPIQENVLPDVHQAAPPIPQATVHVQQTYMTPATYPSYQPPVMSPFHVPQYSMPTVDPTRYPHILPSTLMDSHLPLLMSETRSQNAEMRMTLNKIGDKVDTVLQKVDDLRVQGRGSTLHQVPYLDSSIIVQNIERIIRENNQLKQDVELQKSEIQSLNNEFIGLCQRRLRLSEESNSILEQKRESTHALAIESQAKLADLEMEKVKLTADLSQATTKISVLKTELKKCQDLENQLQEKLKDHEHKAEKKFNESDSQSSSDSLRSQLQDVLQQKTDISEKLQDLENKCRELTESEKSAKQCLEETKSELRHFKLKSKTEFSEMEENLRKEIQNCQSQLKDAADKLLNETNKNLESAKNKTQELQKELETSLLWKKKYEVFYQKTLALKNSYEAQIAQLNSDLAKQRLSAPSGSADFSGEIKKVMNALYKLLQGKFESSTSYSGAQVLETTLQNIKMLTLQALEMKRRASSESSESNSESGIGKNTTHSSNQLPETMTQNDQGPSSDGQNEPKQEETDGQIDLSSPTGVDQEAVSLKVATDDQKLEFDKAKATGNEPPEILLDESPKVLDADSTNDLSDASSNPIAIENKVKLTNQVLSSGSPDSSQDVPAVVVSEGQKV